MNDPNGPWWEHTVLEVRIEEYAAKVNELARDGWELVSVRDAPTSEFHFAVFFKRRFGSPLPWTPQRHKERIERDKQAVEKHREQRRSEREARNTHDGAAS